MKAREKYNFQAQNGLSLVELLVVMVVIAIVAALALMSRPAVNEQLRRQQAARELKVAFERARFDSVKRRADSSTTRAYVEIFPNSFTLRTDLNQDGTLDASDDKNYPFPSGIVADGYGFSLGSSKLVEFDRRGKASVADGSDPEFMICSGASCPTAPGNASTSHTVLVTLTGTVNLLDGGIAVPTFNNPTVDGSFGSNSNIRSIVTLP